MKNDKLEMLKKIEQHVTCNESQKSICYKRLKTEN